MKTDNLKDLFDELDFDIAQPESNHENRFREKLKSQKKKKLNHSGIISLWLPGLAVAASFLMAFLIFQGMFGDPFSQQQELASVSPEMKQTQEFYSSAIRTELANLKEKQTPETEAVINDALRQMQILETDYENLKKDLGKSGQDQRVIYAMITNFQKRIDLLKTVLDKVNNINNLNNNTHEDNFI